MTHHKAILLLGSNKFNKKANLQLAAEELNQHQILILQTGNITETEAEGFASNENFLNQIVEVSTHLSPVQLLYTVKNIEYRMGREYPKPKSGEKYTDRIIDIDILYYDNLHIECAFLNIPHPQIQERKFVGKLLKNYYSTL